MNDSHSPSRAPAETLRDVHRGADALKEAADQLLAAAEALEQTVRQRTLELASTIEKLEQEMAQRQRIEAALRASEEQFRTEFQAVPVPVYMWRKTGDDFTLVDFNDAAVAMTRGGVRRVVGQTLGQWYEGRPDIIDDVWRCFREHAVVRRDMPYRFSATGEIRHLIVAYVYVPPETVMVHTVDISERVRAEQALKREEELLREMLALQDRDRKLLAYEIHDGLAQQLAASLMMLQGFRETLGKEPEEAWKTFDAGLRTLGQGVAEARRLISGLRPPVLDEAGVVAAVEYLVCEAQQAGGPSVELTTDVQFDRLAPPLESAIFRIVQESLTNACRHSKSEKVAVRLVQRGERVRVEVRDWGAGFVAGDVRGPHFGLHGIRERARLLGGRAHIRSVPGRGTRVVVELPLLDRSPEPARSDAAP